MNGWGVEFDTVDLADEVSLRAAIRDRTRIVWLETPTNPLMKIVDIERVAAISREAGAVCVVDNTFATPYLQRPLGLGADVVVHSVTKYLGGHSDLVSGAIVTSDDELIERLTFLQNAVGAVPGPMDCYLALRGVKTLAARMMRRFGGMVSFETATRDEAIALAERTQVFFLAESLGGVESLIEVPG